MYEYVCRTSEKLYDALDKNDELLKIIFMSYSFTVINDLWLFLHFHYRSFIGHATTLTNIKASYIYTTFLANTS